MILEKVFWTPKVNMLVITCDCKNKFIYPCNHSLVECPSCHNKEFWHADALTWNEIYSTNYKLMMNKYNKQ
jgi:hypothetical protein